MFKKIALIAVGVIVIAVAVILSIAAGKPDSFRVERSTSIKAPPERIFAILNDLHSWKQWSPYEEKDPNMKRTFSGAEKGKGATYAWDGNDQVGAGSMEIAEATEPSKLSINLHFIKPFQGDNVAEFIIVPEGEATKVTWAMQGQSPYMCKVMQIFINMDDCCGKDFEKGLAKLKTTTEAAPKT
jgi:uncharacterized protein YndB with AHSA1/START domain